MMSSWCIPSQWSLRSCWRATVRRWRGCAGSSPSLALGSEVSWVAPAPSEVTAASPLDEAPPWKHWIRGESFSNQLWCQHPQRGRERAHALHGSWAECWLCEQEQAWELVLRMMGSSSWSSPEPCSSPHSGGACRRACSSHWTRRIRSTPSASSLSSGSLAVAWGEEPVEHHRLPPHSAGRGDLTSWRASSSCTPHSRPCPQLAHSFAPLAGAGEPPPCHLCRSIGDPSCVGEVVAE